MFAEIYYAVMMSFILFGYGTYGFYMFIKDWLGWQEDTTEFENSLLSSDEEQSFTK